MGYGKIIQRNTFRCINCGLHIIINPYSRKFHGNGLCKGRLTAQRG